MRNGKRIMILGTQSLKRGKVHKIKQNMIVLLTLIFGNSKNLKYKKMMKKNLYKKTKYKRYFTWSTVGRCISIDYKNKKLKLKVKNKKMKVYLILNIDLKSKTLLLLAIRKREKWKF